MLILARGAITLAISSIFIELWAQLHQSERVGAISCRKGGCPRGPHVGRALPLPRAQVRRARGLRPGAAHQACGAGSSLALARREVSVELRVSGLRQGLFRTRPSHLTRFAKGGGSLRALTRSSCNPWTCAPLAWGRRSASRRSRPRTRGRSGRSAW